MILYDELERFYTDSKENENLVDQISIDIKKKRYILDLSVNDIVTDGCDESGEPIGISHYVSRFIFDIIVKAMKDNNFKEYICKE